MTYLHLLSPEGEPFEVIETRVGPLLANGWSFNPGPLKDAIARIEESDPVTTEGSVEVSEPQGAIADAEDHSNDIPVDVEQENFEAGPDAEAQSPDVIDGPASERVEERKPRRRFVQNDGE